MQVPFTDEFKARVRRVTNASTEFGVIPHEHWFQPDWVNETLAEEKRVALSKVPATWPIPYALSVSYRNMCRFNSGVSYSCRLFHNRLLTWFVAVLFPSRAFAKIQVVLEG